MTQNFLERITRGKIQQHLRLLKEALCVPSKGIIFDSVAPLPKNAGGIGIRIVEGKFGRAHNANFKAFLAAGGISGILPKSDLLIRNAPSPLLHANSPEPLLKMPTTQTPDIV